MKTFIPKIEPNSKRWILIDLEGATVGRVATRVASILRGKTKTIFTPHLDVGDHVIAVNAAKLRVTGKNKPRNMIFYSYTGYPGGLRQTSFEQWMQKKPEKALEVAVQRMLPKTRLGRKMIKKLHVYAGPEHPHVAQKPEKIQLFK